MAAVATLDSEVFQGLSDEERARVLAIGRDRRVAEGEVLFRLGAEADELYVIREGSVDLTFPLLVMGETKEVRFQTLGPGRVLAWSALVPPYRLTMGGRSRARGLLTGFRRAEISKLLVEDTHIGFTILRNIAAVVGDRLLETQALWVREVQRTVSQRYR